MCSRNKLDVKPEEVLEPASYASSDTPVPDNSATTFLSLLVLVKTRLCTYHLHTAMKTFHLPAEEWRSLEEFRLGCS